MVRDGLSMARLLRLVEEERVRREERVEVVHCSFSLYELEVEVLVLGLRGWCVGFGKGKKGDWGTYDNTAVVDI